MTTMYYGGDFSHNGSPAASYYQPQQGYADQNYNNIAPNYANYTPQNYNQGYYSQNYTTPSVPTFNSMANQAIPNNIPFQNNYNMNGNYQNPNQFYQPQNNQMQQGNMSQRPKSAPHRNRTLSSKQQNQRPSQPLEIRGSVLISGCHCAKKNGLQDHCGRSTCRAVNEEKRRRHRMWQEVPTRDDSKSAQNPSGDANKLIPNPAYVMECYENQTVPSNAQPVPVAPYNFQM